MYTEHVRAARRWLEGRGEGPLALLEARMTKAAARLDFEYAAVLRDRAAHLAELSERLAAGRGEVDGLTFLYRVPGFRGADRLYLIRRGRVRTELEYPKGARASSSEPRRRRSGSRARSAHRRHAPLVRCVAVNRPQSPVDSPRGM